MWESHLFERPSNYFFDHAEPGSLETSIKMRRIGSDEEDSQGDDDRNRLGDIMVGTEWEVGRPILALPVYR